MLYTDNMAQFGILSDEQAGRLIKAIFTYEVNKEIPKFNDGMLDMAFSFIKSQLDRDTEKWEKIRQKRSEAGRKGGKQTKANQANASFAKQNEANQAVNVNVNDNVNVNVNDIPPIVPQGDKQVFEPKKDSFSESFDDFWKAYPRKVSKTNALKAWNELKPNDELVRIILAALEKHKKASQWQKGDGDQYIPYPAKWINDRRWEDELTEESECSFDSNLADYKSLVNNFGD